MRNRLEECLFRNPLLETAWLAKGEVLAISASLTLADGGPGIVALDPANASQSVITYTPAITSLWRELLVFNIGTGTGNLNIKDPTNATTLGVVAPGQLATLVWNPKTQAWTSWVQTNGQTQTPGAQITEQQYTTLAALANAQVISMAIPYGFKLNSVGFRTRVVASTAAKAATLTAQVNGVSVTGGVVSLTTANQNTSGALTAGTSITAGNIGTAGQTIGVVVSGVTAFLEGDGYVEYNLTNTGVNL